MLSREELCAAYARSVALREEQRRATALRERHSSPYFVNSGTPYMTFTDPATGAAALDTTTDAYGGYTPEQARARRKLQALQCTQWEAPASAVARRRARTVCVAARTAAWTEAGGAAVEVDLRVPWVPL